MKKLFTILLTSLVFTTISAQKVEVKDDKILVDGTEYAILIKTSGGISSGEFSLKTTGGDEVAIAKLDLNAPTTMGPATAYYIHITFMGSGNQASMMYTTAFKKQFAKEVVKCELFEDGKYKPEGEKKFMILNPYKPTGDQSAVVNNVGNSSSNYDMVTRNRSAMLAVYSGSIQQDFKTIGTVKETTNGNNGKPIYMYKFYLPDGTLVAEATVDGLNAKTANIYTFRDEKKQYVTIRMKATAPDDIATWLAKNFYL